MIEDAVKAKLMSKLKRISEDNDNEPIYNSFVRWVCKKYLNIDNEDDIEDIISVGGKHDYDVDYFVHKDDGDESYMAWGQVKFSETFDKVVVRSEMETFAKTLAYLQHCPENANNRFKEHSKIFNELGGKNAHIAKKMTFIVAGTVNDDVDLLLDSKDWKRNFDNEIGPKIDFRVISIDKIINDLIRPPTEDLSIKFDELVLPKEDKSTGNESVIGFVKARDITLIVKEHPGLFGLNVRQSLKKGNKAYIGMTKTLNDSKKKKQFWKLNNGITAVCKSFKKDNVHGAVSYVVEDLQIVNGRQTTYCLHENSKIDSKLLDDVLVSVRIHQIESKQEAIDITNSTNTQNTVKEVDQISNYDEIGALAVKCSDMFPDFYFERQTAGFESATEDTRLRVTPKRLLDKEKTARAYLAYSNSQPNDAMIPSNDLFSIEKDPTYYNAVFKNREIKELIIPHIFTYMVNSLDLKWGNEHRKKIDDNYHQKQILHKLIVQYFMLDLIGYTMRDLKDSDRTTCEDKLIDMMKKLNKKDSAPSEFLEIAVVTLDFFMHLFNTNKLFTWPDELVQKIKTPGYVPDPYDKPDHDDIRRKLVAEGVMIRNFFVDTMKEDKRIGNENPIKNVILKNLK